MIDVVSMRAATTATRSGAVVARRGICGLDGPVSQDAEGDLVFPALAPDTVVRWRSAEVIGTFAEDSVRIRFVNSLGETQYLDPDTMTFEGVSDTTSWESEWTEASLLSNLDLWTNPSLAILIHMARTDKDRDPSIVEVRVLADFPVWAGAIAHCVRAVVEAVGEMEPILLIEETTTQATSSWKIGHPHTEHDFRLTELVQVAVDGRHRSATLADGIVTVVGDPVPAGSAVAIAVKYLPNTAVKRIAGVATYGRVPMWLAEDLVILGGLDGRTPLMTVGGYDVESRRVELRITVKGAAGRTADVLAMRAAIQEKFSGGVDICMPSGRYMTAGIDGFVEVIDATGNALPQAVGVVTVPIQEFVSSTQTRLGRTDAGEPVYTSLTIELGGEEYVVDIESNVSC